MFDWGSRKGQALLWRAYPEGCLRLPGVTSLGRFHCCYAAKNGQEELSWWSSETALRVEAESRLSESILKSGRLLPRPDPEDVATWACLLFDLARSLGWPVTGAEGLYFGGDEGTGCWTLRGERQTGLERTFPGVDAGDVAEALIQARASLRGVS